LELVSPNFVKQAAAEVEVNWNGVGAKEGIVVWRVENVRDENDNPKFGINPWPEENYGEFYEGDSYIVLRTEEDQKTGTFLYDIFFWIGSKSSQDEYGVAAYKAVELDDFLDDAPLQHREVQHCESEAFLKCFGGNIRYLLGGVDSGFRKVQAGLGDVAMPSRLYLVRKTGKFTRSSQVPLLCESLNNSDAFILDNGEVVYTWFGEHSNPFEKNKAAEVAHNLVLSRNGQCTLVEDCGESDEFWNILGGKGNIKESGDVGEYSSPKLPVPKMYCLSDKDSFIKIEERTALLENLETDDVFLVDTGDVLYVWVGKGSTLREQSQAMLLAQKHIHALGRDAKTNVVRVLEGQENRIHAFTEALSV
jgi:Vesicle coat complex COPII, subunit SEC24/subunit SFB2/subunit SFB3